MRHDLNHEFLKQHGLSPLDTFGIAELSARLDDYRADPDEAYDFAFGELVKACAESVVRAERFLHDWHPEGGNSMAAAALHYFCVMYQAGDMAKAPSSVFAAWVGFFRPVLDGVARHKVRSAQ